MTYHDKITKELKRRLTRWILILLFIFICGYASLSSVFYQTCGFICVRHLLIQLAFTAFWGILWFPYSYFREWRTSLNKQLQ